jgi:hypothetical protein
MRKKKNALSMRKKEKEKLIALHALSMRKKKKRKNYRAPRALFL